MKNIWKLILLAAVIFALPIRAIAGGEPEHVEGVKEWLNVVHGNRAPSLADYMRFEGSGSEWELQLERAHCTLRGWRPAETNTECIRFSENRSKRRAESQSFFFEQIRKLLPNSAEIRESKVVGRSAGEGVLPYEMIRARIGTHEVEFGKPKQDQGRFGWLAVNRIDGVGIDEWVDKWVREIERASKGNDKADRPD
jgi:hypothetical protein